MGDAFLDEDERGDEENGKPNAWRRWLLTGLGVLCLLLGIGLALPGIPLAGPRPILAIVLLMSVGVWLLRLAWQAQTSG